MEPVTKQSKKLNETPTSKDSKSQSSMIKKVSLALQGGGAHGAFTWGVLDKLLEDGRFLIEGVSGTSAGGMNALSLIQGLMKGGLQGGRDALYEFWKTMSHEAESSPIKSTPWDQMRGYYNLNYSPMYHYFKMMQMFFSPYQMNPLNINPLQQVVKEFFDFENLRQYKDTKLFLCATHVKTGKLKIFGMEDICEDVLLASACLPFLFHAVKVNNEYYWDGGFVGNPAIYPLIYECATPEIIIIQLTTLIRNTLPQTATEIVDRHKEITYNACLMREMRSINYISQLIDKGILDANQTKRLHVHLIRNDNVFTDLELSSSLNADWTFLQELFAYGRETADKWITENYEHIGVRTTAQIEKDFV